MPTMMCRHWWWQAPSRQQVLKSPLTIPIMQKNRPIMETKETYLIMERLKPLFYFFWNGIFFEKNRVGIKFLKVFHIVSLCSTIFLHGNFFWCRFGKFSKSPLHRNLIYFFFYMTLYSNLFFKHIVGLWLLRIFVRTTRPLVTFSRRRHMSPPSPAPVPPCPLPRTPESSSFFLWRVVWLRA